MNIAKEVTLNAVEVLWVEFWLKKVQDKDNYIFIEALFPFNQRLEMTSKPPKLHRKINYIA